MSGKDDLTFFGYHVACLIDVLGQKDQLAKWRELPDGGQTTPEFIQALKRTAGTVLGFRDHYLTFFDQFEQPTTPNGFAPLSKDHLKKYQRAKECRVRVERFADTFVFSSQIANAYGDASTVPTYRILAACSMAMVVSLAARVPVRGAITVGMGAVLEDGSFYGPALAEAHSLESEVAAYPRVVVSPTVLEFLAGGGAYSQDPVVANIMGLFVNLCDSFICQDTDGYWIVDFLGEGTRRILSPDADVVRLAYNFVRLEEKRFRDNKEREMEDRYHLLHEYIESRLPLWGIPMEH